MKENRLKHLYVQELKDIYSAENQMVKALPKMAKAATSADLRSGFEEHLKQTEEHVARLEQIFEALGESPKGKKCKGMEGLVAEGAEMIEEDPPSEELDAGLISAARRVEHYEIAAYGGVCAYAKLQAFSLLRKTLEEEKKTNEKLTELSTRINIEAANSEGNESHSGKSSESKAKAHRA